MGATGLTSEIQKAAEEFARSCDRDVYDEFAKEADVRFRLGSYLNERIGKRFSMFELHFETNLSKSWFPQLEKKIDWVKRDAYKDVKRVWLIDITIYGKIERPKGFEACFEVKHFSDEQKVNADSVRDDLKRLASLRRSHLAKSCYQVVAYDYSNEEKKSEMMEVEEQLSASAVLVSARNSFAALWRMPDGTE